MDKEVKKEIEEAVRQARADPMPNPETDLFSDVVIDDEIKFKHRGTLPSVVYDQ